MSTMAVAADWRRSAACSTADPELFFPDPDTSVDDIAKAKEICGECPVKAMCLREALRSDDQEAICGGLTPEERLELAASGQVLSRFQSRRVENNNARLLAMTYGADMLVWLVNEGMTVPDVADRLSVRPRAVYQAWRMLVPPASARAHQPSAVERVLVDSSLELRALERAGSPHEEIASLLRTSQNIVSSSLRVLAQRDEALDRLERPGEGLESVVSRVQAQEYRVRSESGSGLTVGEVVQMLGPRIQQMTAEGKPLRHVAEELGICRETVRRAHKELTAEVGRELTQSEMESAA
jgi:WhiB family redox-sensing transcriptional regulator